MFVNPSRGRGVDMEKEYPSRDLTWEWGRAGPQELSRVADSLDTKAFGIFAAACVIMGVFGAMGGKVRLDATVTPFLLAFIAFINLILAIAFNLVRATLWEQLRAAANLTGVYEQVNPHLINYELLFWTLFLMSAGGAIIWYIVGSDKEEHEQYRG